MGVRRETVETRLNAQFLVRVIVLSDKKHVGIFMFPFRLPLFLTTYTVSFLACLKVICENVSVFCMHAFEESSGCEKLHDIGIQLQKETSRVAIMKVTLKSSTDFFHLWKSIGNEAKPQEQPFILQNNAAACPRNKEQKVNRIFFSLKSQKVWKGGKQGYRQRKVCE